MVIKSCYYVNVKHEDMLSFNGAVYDGYEDLLVDHYSITSFHLILAN